MIRRRKVSPASHSPVLFSRQMRLKVVPLAIGAIAITCGSMAVASTLLHDVTDRPGVDIIKDQINALVDAPER